jgi:urease accessory protein
MIRSTKTLTAGSFDASTAIDSVELDFEDRRRRRGTLTGVKGTEFHVDLAEAPTLVEGDAFVLDDGGFVVVNAKPERLAEFRSDDPHVVTRVAWHLGNRHTPTQLLDRALRIRDDYVLVELVKKLGADVGFVTAAFQPEGGAYGLGSVSGHEHHDHGHDKVDEHGTKHGHQHKHDHVHDHDHTATTNPLLSDEDRLMAETIARRDARRAARSAEVHVHGPDCGHDHDDHGHNHAHDHAHAHDHDHAGHKHDHDHDHGHAHSHGDHDHH